MSDIPLPISCNCLNPSRVFNPYTNEFLTVPCGHCRACIIQKNDRYCFQCDLEAYVSKKQLFVTLTYAQSTIPTSKLVPRYDVGFTYDMIETRTGENLGEVTMTEEQKRELEDKAYCFGNIPYLRKTDLQSFLKRLRYYVGKRTASKIRYYGVGEYGPVHFRPHFHLLLFLDSEETAQICREAVYKSWTFGRCEAEYPKHKISSYLTSYLTSNCDIPRIYQLPTTRPFCVHSQRLGQGFLKNQGETVYQLTARDFIKKSLTINGQHREFRLWRSCYAWFFPKVKGYHGKSDVQLRYSYSIYRYAKECFPVAETVMDLARDVAEFCKLFKTLVVPLPKIYVDLYDYFTDVAQNADYDSDDWTNYVNRIYQELLVSRHFLFDCCKHNARSYPTSEEVRSKVLKIKEFYKQLELLRLSDYFESQRLYMESDFQGDEDVSLDRFGNEVHYLFYDNATFDKVAYKQMRVYHEYEQSIWKRSRDRVKHKILNDKNLKFVYM